MEEIQSNLPQVFLEKDVKTVRQELDQLTDLSDRFRASSKVGQILPGALGMS